MRNLRGKGINVSRVLQTLQVPSTALGFIGGFPGQFIENTLKAEGIHTAFTQVDEDTRINVKVKSQTETEINSGWTAHYRNPSSDFIRTTSCDHG